MDFSCCFDTGDEEYIAIEAEGAAKLDADIVIEIDVVGDRNDNFEPAIDVDLDSDTENEAANDTGAADDIDWVVNNVTDDEAVRWNDDFVPEKDGVGKTESDRAAEDGAKRKIEEDVGGDTVTGSSVDIDDDRGKNLDAVGDTETDAEFTIGSVTDFDATSDPGKYVFSNDVAESDTCTDPDSCSDIDFEGDIDDSPKCARDNGAEGDANVDAVNINGIDDNFDTHIDGVFDNSADGKTIIDFDEESDADGDTDRDSSFDSEKEGTFAGFKADHETVRNVGDRDTDNECETDMDVVFDNNIEGTACFETDADSDRGVVCITDDCDANIDFVCDNKLDGDTVSDCNADNDTNDNTVRDDGLVIATDAEYADKDFVGDNDTDDDRDTIIDVECDTEIKGATEKDSDGDSDTGAGSDSDDTSSDNAVNEADDTACEINRVEGRNSGVVGDSNADTDTYATGNNDNDVGTNTETVWDTDANAADDFNNVSSCEANSDAKDAVNDDNGDTGSRNDCSRAMRFVVDHCDKCNADWDKDKEGVGETGTDGAADIGAERNIDTDASGDTDKVVNDNSALDSTTDKEKRSCCFDLDTESDTGTDVVLDNFADGNTDSSLDVDSDIDVDSDNDNVSERVRDNGANSDTDKDAFDTVIDADFTTNFVAEFVANSDTDEDVCSDTDADRDADCDSDPSDGRVGDIDK